jgi:hypothetical protein
MSEEPDREHFGEASLGEAESETQPPDPDMPGAERHEPADAGREIDPPPIEPEEQETTLDEATEDAAAEAGAIGGRGYREDLPEEERPLAESGEGVAEGFEQSEDELIESASHGQQSGNPLGDRLPAEDAESEGLAEYGEADHEMVSEETKDDHR